MQEIEYIYLLQEREFIRTNDNIYKIGKTKQENLKRFSSYPNGSKLLIQIICQNCDLQEKYLISLFKQKYIHKKDIGNEYFEGDYNAMIKDIYISITNNDCINYHDTDSKIIKISNYNDFKKYSSIHTIVISNVHTQDGYIKFKNKFWTKLYSKYKKNEILTLKSFINNHSDVALDKYGDITLDDNGFCTTLEYNYDEIIKDICTTCYFNDVGLYNLKYCEYAVTTNPYEDIILNVFDFTITIYDDIDHTKIITEDEKRDGFILFVDMQSALNTDIVYNILKSLVNSETVQKYNALCYSCLVNEQQTIFFDYSSNTSFQLTAWIRSTLFHLSSHKLWLHYDEYVDDIKEFTKQVKKCKPRLVIVNCFKTMTMNNKQVSYVYTPKQVEQIIDFLKKLDIKNIILCVVNASKSLYTIQPCLDFIFDNKKIIIEYSIDKEYIIDKTNVCLDDIFYNPRLLFNHYLKWCCVQR